jgi:hypothetical protein
MTDTCCRGDYSKPWIQRANGEDGSSIGNNEICQVKLQNERKSAVIRRKTRKMKARILLPPNLIRWEIKN